MTVERLRNYLLKKSGASENFPFDTVTPVFKVCGKMFALLLTTRNPLQVNLKCLPEKAEVLREQFPAIRPGYHMNKRHWNTLVLDGSLPDALVFSLVDESYELVLQGVPKATRPGR